MLSARRADRLDALADELRSRHGIRVECIAADLAVADTPRQLCDEMTRRGIAIDILINNAGYGVPGQLLKPGWSRHADSLQVMITAPCELVYRLLPGMRERGYGRIINVASLAGLIPGSAGHTMYAAQKAFLIRFSQSLSLENVACGVHVCALCPGFTYSEFHDVTGTRDIVSRLPKWMWMQADAVARIGMDAVERGETVCVTGRANRAIKTLFKVMPERFALRLVQRRSKQFRAQD